jgi:predicted RNA-binding Zn ribbon-like protein
MSLARYVAATAPGGLALVQGLLNTQSTASGHADLLDDESGARTWLAAGLREWGDLTGSGPIAPAVGRAQLAELRALRARVRSYIAGDRVAARIDQPIAVVSNADGTLRTQPTGTGIRWVESAVWGAVLMAQDRDTLKRLKLCRNEPCGAAFYDRSKNNSGVWHDVHVCGNAANLRASRARRRAVSS